MRVELDSELQEIVVDGVRISLALLRRMANPPLHHFMLMERVGDVVTVHVWDPRCEELHQAIAASVAVLDTEATVDAML